MKQWEKEVEIKAPIEEVWKLLDGSLEDMQKMTPHLVANEPITVTDEVVGSVYRQKYEGRRSQSLDVETLEYNDQSDHKQLKIGFSLSNMAEVTASYELKKIDETTTHFRYISTNKPLKWLMRLLLFFSGKKVVVQFANRVKRISEQED